VLSYFSGGPNSSFAKDDPVVPTTDIAGEWAVKSVTYAYAVCSKFAAGGAWMREISSGIDARNGGQAKGIVNVAMPKGLTLSARPRTSGEGLRIEAGWLISSSVRSVVAMDYDANGVLISTSNLIERKVVR
jgi:hypothetical protein